MSGIFDALGFPMWPSHSCDKRPDDGSTLADGGKGSRLDRMIDGTLPDVNSKQWHETDRVYFSHGKKGE